MAEVDTDVSLLSEETCLVASDECRQGKRGQGTTSRKEDQQARYWSYLFDNLHRVVDEIYCTCEADRSVVECEEMMTTLDVCKRDFECLIKRIEVEDSLEGDPLNRPQSMSWEIQYSPYRSRPSSRLSDIDQHANGLSHMRQLEFTPHSSARRRRDEGGVRDRKKSEENIRDTFQREPTPVSALFSGHGFELASEVVQKTELQKTPLLDVPAPRLSLSPSSPSSLSVPVVHKSQGGKLQVYVDVPDNASLNYYQRESMRVIPDSHMMVAIEADNPPEEGWEVVHSRNRRALERRIHNQDKRSGRDECGVESSEEVLSVSSATSEQHVGSLPGGTVSDSSDVNQRVQLCSVSSSSWGGGQDQEERQTKPQDRLVRSDGALELLQASKTTEKRFSVLSEDLDNIGLLSPEVRSPAKLGHLHQKLSSPQRRKLLDTEESRRLLEDKLAKAKQQRDKIHEERAQRMRSVSQKVEEIRVLRDEETEKKRIVMEEKLERAKMLRDSHLQEIIRKAKEEDTKKNEIAFISNLEAQNKRMQVLERHMGHEARLQDIQEVRQRKKEEQLAKEEAALERRRTLEAERMARLQEIHQKRQEQDAKRELKKFERERAREEAAKEKAKERERKLVARQTATEELERKIQLKHDESAKRHGIQLEQIREKAALVSRHASSEDSLRVTPYDKRRWCRVCQVMIISELYLMTHLRSKRHQEATATLSEEEADQSIVISESQDGIEDDRKSSYDDILERMRKNKKRVKKLRNRIHLRVENNKSTLAKETVPSTSSAQLKSSHKLIRELRKHVETCRSHGGQLNALDKTLGEIVRHLSSRSETEKVAFAKLEVMDIMSGFLQKLMDGHEKNGFPIKSISLMAAIMRLLCQGCYDNCVACITGNHFQPLVDVTVQVYLGLLHDVSSSKAELQNKIITNGKLQAIISLLSMLAALYSSLAGGGEGGVEDELEKAIYDSIGYAVGVGVFDCFQSAFNPVCGPLEDRNLAEFLVSSVNLLIAVSAFLQLRVKNVFAKKPLEDTTLFVDALQRTELFGVPTLLYAILLHEGPPRHSSTPPTLPNHTIAIATAAMKLINNASLINFSIVQSCLGDDSISVQFRIVTSYLIWHCTHHRNDVLLHELILAVGYFCVLNPHNQVLLTAGRSPTLVQLLCTLPFEYFSKPRLVELLFPTLICACYHNDDNKAILEQEISCQLVQMFLKDQLSKYGNTEHKSTKSPALNMTSFRSRFPRNCWEDALKYFEGSSNNKL